MGKHNSDVWEKKKSIILSSCEHAKLILQHHNYTHATPHPQPPSSSPSFPLCFLGAPCLWKVGSGARLPSSALWL